MSFPTFSDLVGHNFDDIDGNGLSHRQWMANVGAALAGVPVYRAFPFAFDTPNLLTGADVYTPAVGDLLIDAWIEIDTAWDGAGSSVRGGPLGDFGEFATGMGWISSLYNLQAVDMGMTDLDISGSDGLLVGSQQASSLASSALLGIVPYVAEVDGAGPSLQKVSNGLGFRITPAKFTTTDPIKVCVSQDGTNAGADPGSTQGAAILYLATVTPV